MIITANSTESRRKIYNKWKKDILPKEINDKNLLDNINRLIPNEWSEDGRFSFHHFTRNFPQKIDRLICEDPCINGNHVSEEKVMSMLRKNDPVLLDEMKQIIVIPTYMHNHENIIEKSMDSAYEKYFEMEKSQHVEMEMKKFLMCIKELQKVKKKFTMIFEGYDQEATGKIIEDIDQAIGKLRSFKLNLKKELNKPSMVSEDLTDI